MTHAAKILVAVAAIVAITACDPTTLTSAGASENGQVTWRVRDQRVEVTNATTGTIRYAVIGRTFLHNAAILWCFGGATCGTALPTKLTALVQYIDISGSAHPETEVMIVWWTPNGPDPVPFDTAIVRIR